MKPTLTLKANEKRIAQWEEASREYREHPEKFKQFDSFEELSADLEKMWRAADQKKPK